MDLPSFDAICLRQVLHVSVYEWGSIVTNQSLGGPEPCDDVLPNEVCHNCSSGLFQRDNFYLFCKILGGCQDPYMAIGRRVYEPYKIKPQSVERPKCCHVLQHIWMSMDCISKYLACRTRLNQLLGVLFHCCPIVPQLQQLPIESSFPWVLSTITGMDFPDYFFGFPRPQAS